MRKYSDFAKNNRAVKDIERERINDEIMDNSIYLAKKSFYTNIAVLIVSILSLIISIIALVLSMR